MNRTLRHTATLTGTLVLCLLLMGTAGAEGWQHVLSSHPNGPETILAIDKDSQTFFMLRSHSPLKLERSFPCTTGQLAGDKQVRGDLRTPEGVYFITYRIDRKLDWDLYGDVAYGLNYPNPIDRLKGKTGSGIWLHGRGKDLVPMDTQGCVALKVPDISSMSANLLPGTPVVIAEHLSWNESDAQDPVSGLLVHELDGWAKSWKNRDEAFFAYYEPGKIERSEGEPFSDFEQNKRNIFASQPWLDVMVANVHTAQGPDYWVTWFDQYYRSPSLVSQVGKRFYWQKDDEGRWRIVGREYTRPSGDLTEDYIARRAGELRPFIDSWAEAWRSADVGAYMAHYASGASQSSRDGKGDIAEYKRELWERKPPRRIDLGEPRFVPTSQGFEVSFSQEYEDATGYSDKGMKTLVVSPRGDGWAIVSEAWRRS
ncbi:MAG: L,D-transpeptidase family protein [Desulfovibrionaceae bacterium]